MTAPQLLPHIPGATPTPDPLIPSLALDLLLQRRDAAVAHLAAISAAIEAYQALSSQLWPPEAPSREPHWTVPHKFREPLNHRPNGRGPYLTDATWLTHATAAVDASLWNHLLRESGLRTFLDAKARDDWDKQIEAHATPPLTADNIRATFATLHAQRGAFFERGVLRVFRSLSWDYKTNRPCHFGRRLILRHVMDCWGHPSNVDPLDDLLRAFHILDHRPEPDHRQGLRTRLWDLSHHQRGAGLVSNDYLLLRVYKNGNGHLTFLRPDLVDRLNQILAKHHPDALPPARD